MERNTSLLKCLFHEMSLLPIYCEDCGCPVCTKCITGSHMKHSLMEVSTYVARQKDELMASINEDCSKIEKIMSELSEMKINTEERKNQVLEEISRREDAIIGEVKDISGDYRSIVGEAALQHIQKIQRSESVLHNIPNMSELKLETEADCIKLLHCRSELRRVEREIKDHDSVHITFEAMKDNCKTQVEEIFGTVCVDNDVNRSSDDDRLIERKKPFHNRNIEDILKATKTKLDKNDQTICIQYKLSVGLLGKLGCKGIFFSGEQIYVHSENEGIFLKEKGREVQSVLHDVQRCINLSSKNGLLVVTNYQRELGFLLRNGEYISIYKNERIPTNKIVDVVDNAKTGIIMLMVNTSYATKGIPILNSIVSIWQFKKTGESKFVSRMDLERNMEDSKICILNDTRLIVFNLHKSLFAFACGKQITCTFQYSGCRANSKLFSASSMCLDSDENILVSDSSDNTIHMLDIKGNFLKIIVWPEDKLLNVKRLSIDKEGHLWIGYGGGYRSNTSYSDICVFDYEYLKKTERTERAITESEKKPETLL